MCRFFSLVSDGKGKPYFFDWTLREKVLRGDLKDYEPDSHTSIADYFGFKKEKEDKLNKYEYNPITKHFGIDQINTKDDSENIKKFCQDLDFKKIVPQLIIKQIVHPFKIAPSKITDADIVLVREWASVWDSVWTRVWASVGASVGNIVGDSVWASVGNSIWDSIWNSVGNSIWDSIWNSVRASVGNSVGDSVGAYFSTFFDIKYKHDFSSAIKLWEKGLVPSFDGTLWRLHGGEKGKILWEGKV